MTIWLWNLLNVGVSLFGYHFAALSIDWKWWGRKRMQVQNTALEVHLQHEMHCNATLAVYIA